MMQPTQHRNRDNRSGTGRLGFSPIRRVSSERLVRARLVVVFQELPKQAQGVRLVENDDMIEALAAEGADAPHRGGAGIVRSAVDVGIKGRKKVYALGRTCHRSCADRWVPVRRDARVRAANQKVAGRIRIAGSQCFSKVIG